MRTLPSEDWRRFAGPEKRVSHCMDDAGIDVAVVSIRHARRTHGR